ncbi:MAG: C25 family cysteine peptidase [Lentimicrobiaceae bacterium]|jgi:hypothetical protein|nr:C25 family cysteine peptidase [Lentimicrobiaceae bacterium]
MKHFFKHFGALFLCSLFLSTSLLAQNMHYEDLRDGSGIRITLSIDSLQFEEVAYRGESMKEILMSGIFIPNEEGMPNLPRISRYIAIPQGATVAVNMNNATTELLKNVNIAPALRIQAEIEDPVSEYIKNQKVYSENSNYPASPIEVSEYLSVRGVDAVILGITPFQYNPVTQELLVYNNIEIDVRYEGGNNYYGQDRLRSPWFDPILQNVFLNYDKLPKINYSARTVSTRDAEGCEYLIVTPNDPAWLPYAEQIRDYRIQQGINTKIMSLADMGCTTTSQMKSFFHNAYNTWEIPPVAVLLMADHGTDMTKYIPAEVISHSYSGTCITDNQYADVTGDFLPEMVFARMTASTTAELSILVSKVLEYENTTPCMDANYYKKPITALGWQTVRWFQICSEVVGGYLRGKGKEPVRINAIYDGIPGSQWSTAQNTPQVVDYFGPNGLGYLPAAPTELGGWTGGTAQDVINAVNSGAYILQHRDHGYEPGWGEPDFTTANIPSLNNVGKMTYVFSINCSTGKFNHGSKCFQEVFQLHQWQGQNAGAVGVLCPTEVSYSFVNDTYTWGVYDLFDPNFMPTYGPYADHSGNWLPAFGNVAGKYFLAQSSWPYNASDKRITYQMFTAHSDAFLRLYTEVPATLDVNHAGALFGGLETYEVTTEEGAFIALTVDNEIIGTAIATIGQTSVPIIPQLPGAQVTLTVTKQDYLRYSETIECIPLDGSYIIYDTHVIRDESGNENGLLDFDENVTLDVSIRNVGNDNSDAVSAVLSTDSPYITITEATADFGIVANNATTTLEQAFAFSVSDDVPNNTKILFNITFDNGEIFESSFTITAYAPEFEILTCTIDDSQGNGNGRLDAGETATFKFNVINKGGAASAPVTVEMINNSPFVTMVSGNTTEIQTITANETKEITFDITTNPSTPIAHVMNYTLNVESGHYMVAKDFMQKIGLIVETFESGGFEEFEWNNTSSSPWTVVQNEKFEGSYSTKSGNIGNNGNTNLVLTYESGIADTLSFYYKVSSESGYDKLIFYIDNVEKGSWSGSVNWTEAKYAVSAGTHQFKWSYTKDVSQTGGSDCAWIDYIVLPAPNVMIATAGPDLSVCGMNPIEISGFTQNYNTLEWSTSGDGTFDNTTIMNPIYTPGVQDIENETVTLQLTATKGDEVIVDEMILTIGKEIEVYSDVLTPLFEVCEGETFFNQEFDFVNHTAIQWTTEGDGSFTNASDISGGYIPGVSDIQRGFARIAATASNEGACETTYAFELLIHSIMNLSMETELTLCSNNDFEPVNLQYDQEAYFVWSTTGDGTFEDVNNPESKYIFGNQDKVNGQVSLTLQAETSNNCNPQPVHVAITLLDAPEATFVENSLLVCRGEEAHFEILLSGTPPFTLNFDNLDPITTDENNFTYTFVPETTTTIKLLSVFDASGCEVIYSDENQSIYIEVQSVPEKPEKPDGPTELDSYYTPTTTFTKTVQFADVYNWILEPEESGTISWIDGEAIVTWTPAYRGDAFVSFSIENKCGESQVSDALAINVKSSVGLNDELAKMFTIYPNPTSDVLNIQFNELDETVVTCRIYNMLGELVFEQRLERTSTTDAIEQLHVGGLENGVYIFSLSTSEMQSNKRVVIRK